MSIFLDQGQPPQTVYALRQAVAQHAAAQSKERDFRSKMNTTCQTYTAAVKFLI